MLTYIFLGDQYLSFKPCTFYIFEIYEHDQRARKACYLGGRKKKERKIFINYMTSHKCGDHIKKIFVLEGYNNQCRDI